ncbi:MAG: LuxR C-terminal-related transcriptional regulator [Candidatus Coprovivens sp.]
MRKILTKREKEIFQLLIYNNSTELIAEKLNISVKTVRNHISNVILKLGVSDRTQAILELLRLDEINL